MRLGRIVEWALVSAGLVACNGILGVGSEYHLVAKDAGVTGCTAQNHCAASEVCLLGACSRKCLEDATCDANWRCLKTDQTSGACVSLTQATCSGDGDCPKGTTCNSGECRADCASANVCGTDQVCSSANVCVGTIPGHDPKGAGGHDGGAGGAAGGGVGGTTSTGGSSGAGGSTNGGGAAASGGNSGTDGGGSAGLGCVWNQTNWDDCVWQ